MEMIRRRVVVHGRVQGFFFRDETRRLAELHRVAGSIRNTTDGTVEAVFEGPPDLVAKLVAYCREGPSGAAVERVELYEESPEGLHGFRITR
jgi:acylphosphatase